MVFFIHFTGDSINDGEPNTAFLSVILAIWVIPVPYVKKRPGLSPYIFCNSNPVMLIDPSGEQTIGVHGTFSNPNTFEHKVELQEWTKEVFGHKYNSNNFFYFKWSGGNYGHMRTQAAQQLVERIKDIRMEVPISEPLTIIGHSQGGNAGIEAINTLVKMPEFDNIEIILITD